MDDRAERDSGAGAPARSRGGGWGFTAGLLIGVAGTIAGLALAIASERRTRRQQTRADASAALPGSAAETDSWRAQQSKLDEDLDQTFPASDPLPQSHRVD